MINSMFNNAALSGLEQSVAFTERRHAILAGNIANMDTPGYQTKDLSVDKFQASLRELIDLEKRKQEPTSPGILSPLLSQFPPSQGKALDQLASSQAIENVRDSMKQLVYHDGSDDSLEMQVTQIAKNQSMHSIAVGLMKSQFRMLQMAISESVNV